MPYTTRFFIISMAETQVLFYFTDYPDTAQYTFADFLYFAFGLTFDARVATIDLLVLKCLRSNENA